MRRRMKKSLERGTIRAIPVMTIPVEDQVMEPEADGSRNHTKVLKRDQMSLQTKSKNRPRPLDPEHPQLQGLLVHAPQ